MQRARAEIRIWKVESLILSAVISDWEWFKRWRENFSPEPDFVAPALFFAFHKKDLEGFAGMRSFFEDARVDELTNNRGG